MRALPREPATTELLAAEPRIGTPRYREEPRVLEVVRRTDHPVIDERPQSLAARIESPLEVEQIHDPRLLGEIGHRRRLVGVESERLVAQHRVTSVDRATNVREVQEGRRVHRDQVDISRGRRGQPPPRHPEASPRRPPCSRPPPRRRERPSRRRIPYRSRRLAPCPTQEGDRTRHRQATHLVARAQVAFARSAAHGGRVG